MPEVSLEILSRVLRARTRDWDTREQESDVPPSREGTVGVAIFRDQVRRLLDAPTARARSLRAEVVRRLQSTRDPLNYIQELLDLCVAGRSKGGLDLAIDILSQAGPLALEFAQEFQWHDPRLWAKTPSSESHAHDDFWDILLRAAARATPDRPETMLLIRCCAGAADHGLRDAAMLALYDLGTHEAKHTLRQMAQDDRDATIRRDAQELLEDLGS